MQQSDSAAAQFTIHVSIYIYRERDMVGEGRHRAEIVGKGGGMSAGDVIAVKRVTLCPLPTTDI